MHVAEICEARAIGRRDELVGDLQAPRVPHLQQAPRVLLERGRLARRSQHARLLPGLCPNAGLALEDWRQDYDHHRPHSALGMMTPAHFAIGYREARLAAARAGDELRSPSGLAAFYAGDTLTLQTQQHPPALKAGGPMNGPVRV